MKVAKGLAAALLIILTWRARCWPCFCMRPTPCFRAGGPAYTEGAADQQARLEEYIQTHSQVAPGEVLTFEWDEAYVDRRPYGTGESGAAAYGV